MIKVKTIPTPEFEHFDPNGDSLGLLNEHEHNDLRIQIMQEQAAGYYLIVDGHKVTIDTNGTHHGFGGYPYNISTEQFRTIIKLRAERHGTKSKADDSK